MARVAGSRDFMKMVAEYLEHALQFEKLAEDTQDPAFKDSLLKQAQAYRRLAGERAHALKTPGPPHSKRETTPLDG